ncbi:MAG TPA: DUF2139 domain-containing protein [Candidatus Aciduliprofundum boonei]|uniref:DUF2139 domain-containing protein n=1 Tax=Candidatus Aciduliprofundum boonei TaxID=379547 RepID=A0A7J3T9A8_9ARCH|nr:DUF2139 domain-containing protein [Candidatus Aciduliprofundum boonei]
MAIDKILGYLHTYPPRYAPEWGSGGIFGLKYYRRMLYYTLAFEGEAHFIKDNYERVYRFEKVGKTPVSGGDTYNAVETVDEYLYFGGWIHTPAIYENKAINFKNKYSHVHVYNIENDSISLLWKDSIHHPTQWAGEVSDIIYDPYNDRLFICREDGDKNLGIYTLERKNGYATKLRDEPTLKGDILHDSIFFASGDNFLTGVTKLLSLDLVDKKWDVFSVEHAKAVDGEEIFMPSIGDVASLYNRFFVFTRGGILVGNPHNEENFRFIRLLDFFNFQAPMRTNVLYHNGGVLIPYNAHHDAVYQPRSIEDKIKSIFTNTISSPTLLLYVTPPMVKIVGVFGARITSIESLGDKILLATNTSPNVGAEDATPYDTGYRGFSILSQDIIHNSPPPVSFSIPLSTISMAKKELGQNIFGGLPLYGYKEARMLLYASRSNELKVYEYDLSLPINEALEDRFEIRPGKNFIDLSSFVGIVSFSLSKEDLNGRIKIELI